MNCIHCGKYATTPYCELHRNPARWDGQLTVLAESKLLLDEACYELRVKSITPEMMERRLARLRSPRMFCIAIKVMQANGYLLWHKFSLNDERQASMTATVRYDGTRMYVASPWRNRAHNEFSLLIGSVPPRNYKNITEWSFPVSGFKKVMEVVRAYYPLTAPQKDPADKRRRIRSTMVRINGRLITGSTMVKMRAGHLRKFEDVFYGAVERKLDIPGHGKRWEATAHPVNLKIMLSVLDVSMQVGMAASILCVKHDEDKKLIEDSFIWRANATRYSKDISTRYPADEDGNEMLSEWDGWGGKYRPYSQQKIAAELCYRIGRWPLWLDMRVGKTLSSMMVARRLLAEGKINHVFVICPTVNIYKPWEEELEGESVAILDDMKAKDEAVLSLKRKTWYIMSYSRAAARLKKLQTFDLERVMFIMDESSAIKNPKAKRTKAVHHLTAHSSYVVGLNGTPMEQGPQDLWSQNYAIDRGYTFGLSYKKYSDHFLTKNHQGKPVLDRAMKAEFMKRLSMSSMRCTRGEADQFSGRDHTFRYHQISPTNEMVLATNRVISGYVIDHNSSLEQLVKQCVLTEYGHLREICGAYDKWETLPDSGEYVRKRHPVCPKTLWLRCYLLANPTQPVVVYTAWSESRARIKEMMDEIGVKYSHLDTKMSLRGKEIDDFENGVTRVFICNTIQARGMKLSRGPALKAGIGVRPAIVYVNPHWSLGTFEQSKDRAVSSDETGRSVNTMIHVLMIAGSIEEKIVKALRAKRSFSDMVLEDLDREGFTSPFEDMGMTRTKYGKEVFDVEEMMLRLKYGISPQRKLTRNIVLKAVTNWAAKELGLSKASAKKQPITEEAQYLLDRTQ